MVLDKTYIASIDNHVVFCLL